MNRINISPRKAALVAGGAYLIVFVCTPYAWISKLIVPGDAATTFQNITSHELLIRIGIVCWLIVLVADTVIAWALYRFLRPVSKSLSLLAAWFRLLLPPFWGSFCLKSFEQHHLYCPAETKVSLRNLHSTNINA